MWWDAIPSFAVIAVLMGSIPMVVYGANYLQFGNPYKRHILYIADAHFYLRDQRISGENNAYNQKGLENIPDEDGTGTTKAGTAKC